NEQNAAIVDQLKCINNPTRPATNHVHWSNDIENSGFTVTDMTTLADGIVPLNTYGKELRLKAKYTRSLHHLRRAQRQNKADKAFRRAAVPHACSSANKALKLLANQPPQLALEPEPPGDIPFQINTTSPPSPRPPHTHRPHDGTIDELYRICAAIHINLLTPQSIKAALRGNDAALWREAIERELHSLQKSGTYDLLTPE
ncbi:hypothetical protein SARC_00583, partial [Sphaeroforma arctica JP610]